MEIFENRVWVIMSKDRKMIAKGTTRNRYLVEVDNLKDKKRYITYSSETKAKVGFKNSFFFNAGNYLPEDLEAVEVVMNLNTVE